MAAANHDLQPEECFRRCFLQLHLPQLPQRPGRYLAAVAPQLRADAVFGNLEGTLTHASYSTKCGGASSGSCYAFRNPPRFARVLRHAGFTALSDASEALLRLTPIIEAVPEADTAVAQRAARVLVRRAKRAFQRAKGSKEVLKRHTWRKREKDRRYASMMLGDNWPGKARRKRAANVTEALGRERDAGLLLARLSANARTPSVVLRQVKRHRRALRKQADKLGARLHRKR